MNAALTVYVAGIGVWSPELADAAALRERLAGRDAAAPAARPPAARLPANERRRAPESVLLAAEVAGQAVAMSGLEPAGLACVFSSSHGDQAITDYMCATLAEAPAELSPTRFHNSVHNAPAGYWTIATGCHRPSNAVCAHHASFGAGLLEAATQAIIDGEPVLLVCSDVAGSGPLATMTACAAPFACALVLTPVADDRSLARLRMETGAPSEVTPLPPTLPAEWIARSPSAPALPLLAALLEGEGDVRLAAATSLGLTVRVERTA